MHWFTFGELVILALIQVGGLGIMTSATLVTLLLSRRLGLRRRLLAQAETKALGLRDLGRVRRIAIFTLVSEAVVAAVLSTWFAAVYDYLFGRAGYCGVFHAISAFNNAGFSLNASNLMPYVDDPVINLTVALAVILGGLGFPWCSSWRAAGGSRSCGR